MASEEKSGDYMTKNAPDAIAAKDEAKKMDMAPGKQRKSSTSRDKEADDPELRASLPPDMKEAKDRLLEYQVTLSYECKEFYKSRNKLIQLVPQYGFIKSGSSSIETTTTSMNAQLFVRVGKLYEALLELDKLGLLVSESISVTDHTEPMFWNNLKATREHIRISRKIGAIRQTAAQHKSWNDKENSLARSEDNLDKAEYEKWKIHDRVSWAKIGINLKGPVSPERIVVPPFRNAFIGLVNLGLELIFALIWLTPIIIIGVLIWMKRKGISNFINKGSDKQE